MQPIKKACVLIFGLCLYSDYLDENAGVHPYGLNLIIASTTLGGLKCILAAMYKFNFSKPHLINKFIMTYCIFRAIESPITNFDIATVIVHKTAERVTTRRWWSNA